MKVLKFYADWCGPCKSIKPIVTEGLLGTGIELEEINIDVRRDYVDQYKVRGVPTLVLLNDAGTPVKTIVGQFTKQQFADFICQK